MNISFAPCTMFVPLRFQEYRSYSRLWMKKIMNWEIQDLLDEMQNYALEKIVSAVYRRELYHQKFFDRKKVWKKFSLHENAVIDLHCIDT